jgi:putative tryptophan/tyrosine transport system substrate-binding protein
MQRREFIAVLGSAAAWPLTARPQQVGRMRRVGILMDGTATSAVQQSLVKAFTEALARQGWIEGKNVTMDIRYNATDATLARIFAAQLIGVMPDVILSASTTNLMILREVTNTVPIVFTIVSGPVEQGFVASLGKPGGNITGFSYFDFSIGAKWLDLLKEIAPGLARIGVMFNPNTAPQSNFFMRSIESAGRPLGVTLTPMPIHSTADIEPAISEFARWLDGGLILPPDSFTGQRSKLIADTANLHRLPSLGANFARYARNDGLMMYYGVAVNLVDQFRQAANYVDRVLKGEKPADLPVQMATKYELVINLKTARALGLTIPETLLATADEVIQ